MQHLSLYEDYSLLDWQERTEGLVKTYTFSSYRDAADFVYEIVLLSEEMDHHPKIVWDHLSVEVITKSHDSDSITQKDRDLAEAIDRL